MNNDLWKLKIQAFLHDPPEKAIMLMRGQSHVSRASELLDRLIGDGTSPPSEVETADRIAAASSRIVVEGEIGGKKLKPQIRFHEKPVLIHPLSGKEFDLHHYGGPLVHYDLEGDDTVLKTAGEAVDQAIDQLKNSYGDDPQKLCFALWRLLPEKLARSDKGEEKSRLGLLWHLLPADTRTPDHSIWDHLSMTSAVASALPKPAFLLFAMGPVQSFISTARRTQDLWMGSYLLSYLTWCATKTVVRELGPDAIIFPNLWRQPLVDQWLSQEFSFDVKPRDEELPIANFPNRFLAIVPEEKAAALAQAAKDALCKEWGEICRKVKQEMESRVPEANEEGEWNELWNKQTADFFETYWIALPWHVDGNAADLSEKEGAERLIERYSGLIGKDGKSSQSEHDLEKIVDAFTKLNPDYVNIGTVYQLLYDLTERALGARKTLRAFAQGEEYGYKCTLCGEREALHPRIEATGETSKEQNIRHFWDQIANKFPGDFRRGGSERLCAVCTTKRLAADAYFKPVLGQKEQRFPSISSIAVASFQIHLLEGIKNDDLLRKAFECYVQKVGELKRVLGINWNANSVYQAWGLVQSKDFPSALRETATEFLHTDGDFLFEETFEPERLRSEYRPDLKPADPDFKPIEDKARQAREALKDLIKRAEQLDIAKPSRYIAVLCADGDSMGKWLSGEYAPKIAETVHPHAREIFRQEPLSKVADRRRPLSPFLHNAISASLRDFSTKLVQLVIENRHAGKLVYAGGDDLLALLPKDKAIAAAREIRMLYSGMRPNEPSRRPESENGFVKLGDELLRMMGEKATLSTGIAIVHHSHSIGDAISKAHDEMLEKHAKKRSGKNAFAFASVRRSGERRIAEGPWFIDQDPKKTPAAMIMEFQKLFAEETLSPRFVYALGDEIAAGLAGADDESIESRIRYLLKRHIEISKMPGSSKEERQREKEKLAERLWDQLALSRECLRTTKGKTHNGNASELEGLLHLLELAVFLAREERA